MAVIRINAGRSGALRDARGGPDWRPGLAAALAGVAEGAPVCVMVHGFRYTWRAGPGDWACPHARLYHDRPVPPDPRCRPERAAWPEALGYAGSGPRDGLAIAFGWEARAPAIGGFAAVHARAARAGAGLARLVDEIAGLRPDLTVDMLSHSLGARVALAAATRRPGLPLGRLVLMGAAEFTGAARTALARLDAAGSEAGILHLLSRANDPYDALFARLAPASEGQPLGHSGLGTRHPRWTDLQLDHPRTAAWLHARGYPLARLGERVSHWHFYADPGAMDFVRAVLRRVPGVAPGELAAGGVAGALQPRWARFLPRGVPGAVGQAGATQPSR